jgi:uncharacterized protein
LIDSYLLYIFFTQRAASRRSQTTSLAPGAQVVPDNPIASHITEPPGDPFAPLKTLLGYVLLILAIAMPIFAWRQSLFEPVWRFGRTASSF